MNFRLFLAILLLSLNAVAGNSNYENRFGVRFHAGTSAYTAVGSKSYGVVLPFGFEGSYGITNALETALGLRISPSMPIDSEGSFALPYAVTIALRYYYNVDEPVKAYSALGTHIALDRFGFELIPSTWGLQWDLDDNIAVFCDGGIGMLVGSNPIRLERWEYNLRVGLNIGLHYHF